MLFCNSYLFYQLDIWIERKENKFDNLAFCSGWIIRNYELLKYIAWI